MADELPFDELLRRVRHGDQDAAAELVRRYGPTVRRVLRGRLGGRGIAVDGSDVYQSVLLSFFARAAADKFDLATPEQLSRLLSAMARNKVADRVRKETAARRDRRREAALDPGEVGAVDAAPGPSARAEAQDLLAQLRRRLTPDEWYALERRAQGDDWATIAAERGESPDALRVRLLRARERVRRELGLDEASDG